MSEYSTQLTIRVNDWLKEGSPYEALQYVQSFIARKKKTLTREDSSTLVFLAAKLLIDAGSFNDTGALLVWFMETGAGEDLRFHLSTGPDQSYCDLDRLLDLIKDLDAASSAPIINKIASAIGQLIGSIPSSTPQEKRVSLHANMMKFEDLCANAFEYSGNYLGALKSICRLGDMDRAAKLLNNWASKGYKYEHPLYFARAALHLLAEGHSEQASDLVTISRQAGYIAEDQYLDATNDNYPCPALAAWHFVTITVELVSLSSIPATTKRKIYSVLCERYMALLSQVDSKMPSLLSTISEVVFSTDEGRGEFSSSSGSRGGGMNMNGGMLDMLNSMMGGGGAGGGIDLKGMMSALQQGQGSARPRPGRS
jgi:hypothetical protein